MLRMHCYKPFALALLPLLLVGEAALAQDGRMKTVIIGLAARRGVDEGLALAMSDVVQGVYSTERTRLVLGREDIRRVLSFEQERAALGCDDASCLGEIANALDVDRMITGSIDKVGSSYFVVITEIDARTVEPLARVQKRLPLDEDQLVTGIQQLAQELLGQSGRAPVARGDGTVGSLFIKAEPAGARVIIDGEEKGITPVRLDGLPPGTHKITIAAVGYKPVDVEVPVYKAEVTEVSGKLGDVGQAPSRKEMKAYADDVMWSKVQGFGKIGASVPCCLVGAPCSAVAGSLVLGTALSSQLGSNLGYVVCGGLGLACAAGLCGWGAYDLFNPPEEPGSSGKAKHRLTIAPPPGSGEVETVEMTAKPDGTVKH